MNKTIYIQREPFHYLSLHKDEVVITLIIISHIHQHYTAILINVKKIPFGNKEHTTD